MNFADSMRADINSNQGYDRLHDRFHDRLHEVQKDLLCVDGSWLESQL